MQFEYQTKDNVHYFCVIINSVYVIITKKVKVNQSRYRPGGAQRVLGS